MDTSNTTWDSMGTTVDSNKIETHVDDDNQTWMIVAIVFIVSTVVLALVVVITGVKHCRSTRSQQNAETPMTELKDKDRRSRFYERLSRYVPFPKKNTTAVPENTTNEKTVTRRKPPNPKKIKGTEKARKGDNYVNVETKTEETSVTIKKEETEASNKIMLKNTFSVSKTSEGPNDTILKTETTDHIYANNDDDKNHPTDEISSEQNNTTASAMDGMEIETYTNMLGEPDSMKSKRLSCNSEGSDGSNSTEISIHNEERSSPIQNQDDSPPKQHVNIYNNVHNYNNCQIGHVNVSNAQNVNMQLHESGNIQEQ